MGKEILASLRLGAKSSSCLTNFLLAQRRQANAKSEALLSGIKFEP
jgi:hypothetical protein